jgi:hypothetical protein
LSEFELQSASSHVGMFRLGKWVVSEPIGNCSKSNASSSHEGESATGGFCVSSTLTLF